MASLFNYFTEDEIDKLILSLEAQRKKWQAVADRPLQGFGKASETLKKDEAASKAQSFNDLIVKISENTF